MASNTAMSDETNSNPNQNMSDPNFDDEDNNPFPHQGIASLMSQHNVGVPKNISPLGAPSEEANGHSNANGTKPNEEEEEDDDDSVLLYNATSKSSDPNKSNGNGNGNGNGNSNSINQAPGADLYNTIQINFESRVSNLLKSNGVVKVQITEAGNSNEGMNNSSKKYIVYTIKLINLKDSNEEILTRRRYSDFESLRDVLSKIFPLVIIPPIPPKNFINFNVLNGFGQSQNGLSAASISSPGGGSSTGATTANSHNQPTNYSYINSTHLNKNRLVEHRKRLLTNFLNNCLEINQIRNLEFFAKFLDPNSNWTDEITLISNQLPKSIYQSNPENGLRTDPIYTHLPNPSNGHMGFLKDNKKKLKQKTNRLLTSGGDPQPESNNNQQTTSTDGPADSDYIIKTASLDDINKKIMENFIGLSNDYTELGTIFNSFSLVLADSSRDVKGGKSSSDDEPKLNIIFDKIGQVFDRSYITINALIGDLETKFSEPLGEAVQFSSILSFISKYQQRKLRQKQLLDSDLKIKRTDLEKLLELEEEVSRIEGVNPVSKNTKYDLEADQQSTPKSQGNKGKFKLFPSIKKITQYVSDIIDQNPEQTRKQKIISLQAKISTLEKCQTIMLEDISYIADELDKNFKQFHAKQLKFIYEILLSYNRFLIGWAKKNVDIWEEVREEIVKL